MADAFVTLVSVQPVVAVQVESDVPAPNLPQQPQGFITGGVYADRRKRRQLSTKSNGAE